MRILRSTLICVSLLVFLNQTTAYAQRPAKGDGEAIKGKVQELLEKTAGIGDQLAALCDAECQGTPAGAKFNNKVQKVKRAHERVSTAHGRSAAADFQEFSRRRPKNPQPQGVVVTSEPEFDEERGKDVIEDLDEVAEEVDELRSILAGHVPTPPPVTTPLYDADYFFPSGMWPSSKVAFGAFVANLAAEKAAAIADHFCDQTAVAVGFGGNGSAACSVVEGVYQVLNGVYQMIEYIGQDVMAAEVTGAYKRAEDIFNQLKKADGDMWQISVVVGAMGQQMLILEENQKKIIELLQTPQGLRSGFPSK